MFKKLKFIAVIALISSFSAATGAAEAHCNLVSAGPVGTPRNRYIGFGETKQEACQNVLQSVHGLYEIAADEFPYYKSQLPIDENALHGNFPNFGAYYKFSCTAVRLKNPYTYYNGFSKSSENEACAQAEEKCAREFAPESCTGKAVRHLMSKGDLMAQIGCYVDLVKESCFQTAMNGSNVNADSGQVVKSFYTNYPGLVYKDLLYFACRKANRECVKEKKDGQFCITRTYTRAGFVTE